MRQERPGTSTSTAPGQCELPPADESVDEEPLPQQAGMARQKAFHKCSAEGMGLFPEAVKKAKIAKGLTGQGGGYFTEY